MQTRHVLIVGVGGLGACMVHEALARSLQVSVLVRHRDKLLATLGTATVDRLRTITTGDGTDVNVLNAAMNHIDVVLSGRGADLQLATALAAAVQRHHAAKLCWPGGTTNVLAEDGATPNYLHLMHLGDWVERAWRAHGACIAAIRATGIRYMIFCPGRMASAGKRSADVRANIRINRDAGAYVSYEDAAWVMLEAATSDVYDNQLVSAATPAANTQD